MAAYEDQEFVRKLGPETVAATLMRAACVLTAYELLRQQVVDAVQEFFSPWAEGTSEGPTERYASDVLVRDKSEYRACVSWLVELDAIAPADGATLEALRVHRNEIAHELPRLVVDPGFDVKPDLLVEAGRILARIGVFWGRIWCAESDGVADEGIRSGSSILYDYVVSLCLSERDAESVAL